VVSLLKPTEVYQPLSTTITPVLFTTPTVGPPLFGGHQVEAGYAICERFNEDGSTNSFMYDECTSFCCGGTVYKNRTGLDCCGSSTYGSPIWLRYQKCCEWWTGHGKAHPKSRYRRTAGCCGTELVFWGIQQCCFHDEEPPQVYDKRRHICCGSKRVSIKSMFPWQSKCCGMTSSFDHRLQSCPCNDGQVMDVPQAQSSCCYTLNGLGTPYNIRNDICCNGEVGKAKDYFCCANSSLGRLGHQVCCSGSLVSLSVPDYTLTECCGGEPYNPKIQVCCSDLLYDIFNGTTECCGESSFNPDLSICCEGNLWSKQLQGTECCGKFPFFSDQGVFCCNGEIQVSELVKGDACCGDDEDRHYYYKSTSEFVCCNGVLGFASSGTSCCGEYPYNEETGICCSGEVFDRLLGDTCCNGSPYFLRKNSAGLTKTICCETGPYGPFITPACCNGVGYDVNGGQVCCQGTVYGIYRIPSCCVSTGYDVSTDQCCNGRIVPNPEGSQGKASCCGENTYDTTKQLCCDDVIVDIPSYIPLKRAVCCEQMEAYDPTTQLCCSGIVYNKTHRYASKCCGDVMYDIRKQICCEPEDDFYDLPFLYDFEYGRRYSKCCGNLLLNSEFEYCCEGTIEEQIYDQTDCCLGFPYDRTKQICCEGVLQEIGPKVPWTRAECCGPSCFFRGPQRCCMNRIYENNKRSYKTCDQF